MNRLFLLSFLFLGGCNLQNGKSEKNAAIKGSLKENTAVAKLSPGIDGCYTSFFKKDTAILKININSANNRVYGKLSYKLFEKDSNSGTLNGIVQDSLIIADYTFTSKGITSVREVVFKISGQNLIEGYGDIVINKNGDSARFKNQSQLQFQEGQPFVKEECK